MSGPEQRVFEAMLSALGGIVELEGEVRAAVSECAHMVAQKSPIEAPTPGASNPSGWRWFLALGDDAWGSSPSEHVASSVSVERVGSHDRVRVWSRGGHAGELVMSEGDGEAFAEMLGLRERMSASEPIRIVSDLRVPEEEQAEVDEARVPDDAVEQLRSMTLRRAYEEGMMVGLRRARRMDDHEDHEVLLLGMVRTCFESYRSKASPDPAQLMAAIGSLLGEPT